MPLVRLQRAAARGVALQGLVVPLELLRVQRVLLERGAVALGLPLRALLPHGLDRPVHQLPELRPRLPKARAARTRPEHIRTGGALGQRVRVLRPKRRGPRGVGGGGVGVGVGVPSPRRWYGRCVP